MGYTEIVLQERRTLDQELLSSFETFKNGCNWRLFVDNTTGENEYYLEHGCYGPNPDIRRDKLLCEWFDGFNKERVKLSGLIQHDTIKQLLKMYPCKECGGARHMVRIYRTLDENYKEVYETKK